MGNVYNFPGRHIIAMVAPLASDFVIVDRNAAARCCRNVAAGSVVQPACSAPAPAARLNEKRGLLTRCHLSLLCNCSIIRIFL